MLTSYSWFLKSLCFGFCVFGFFFTVYTLLQTLHETCKHVNLFNQKFIDHFFEIPITRSNFISLGNSSYRGVTVVINATSLQAYLCYMQQL